MDNPFHIKHLLDTQTPLLPSISALLGSCLLDHPATQQHLAAAYPQHLKTTDLAFEFLLDTKEDQMAVRFLYEAQQKYASLKNAETAGSEAPKSDSDFSSESAEDKFLAEEFRGRWQGQASSQKAYPISKDFSIFHFQDSLKPKRKRADNFQLAVLQSVFSLTKFPSTPVRLELGRLLRMSSRAVQIWFQNQRQTRKSKPREQKDLDSNEEEECRERGERSCTVHSVRRICEELKMRGIGKESQLDWERNSD